MQVLCRPSLLFHSVGKSKSQGQTRAKRRWNKHHLMMKGTERPHFPGCEYRDRWGAGTVFQLIYHRSKMDEVIKCYLVIRGKDLTSSVFQAAVMVLLPYCVFCVYYDWRSSSSGNTSLLSQCQLSMKRKMQMVLVSPSYYQF